MSRTRRPERSAGICACLQSRSIALRPGVRIPWNTSHDWCQCGPAKAVAASKPRGGGGGTAMKELRGPNVDGRAPSISLVVMNGRFGLGAAQSAEHHGPRDVAAIGGAVLRVLDRIDEFRGDVGREREAVGVRRAALERIFGLLDAARRRLGAADGNAA